MVVGAIDRSGTEHHADLIFQALADAYRRDIVRLTMHDEYSQLVTKKRRGREQLVRGRPDTVRNATILLDELAASTCAELF